MSETSKASSRWDAFSKREIADIHHSLRMMTKHPMVGDAERAHFTRLADDVWEYHAEQVAGILASNQDSGARK